MGINSLQSILQSICFNTPWCYAVFWKLKYQHEMILAWEDGFCADMRSREPLGQIEDIYFGSAYKILSTNLNSTSIDGTPGKYPIGPAVAEMSNASHVFGKGVVGEAAFTGIPKWIYSENIASDVYDSLFVVEYPDELLLQFIAGIKTILLLPVLPYGVLQLGSLEMVAEDDTLVAYAKQEFESYKRFAECEIESPFQKISSMSTYMKNYDEPSTIAVNEYNVGQKYITVGTKELNLGTGNHMMPVFVVQDICKTVATGITNAYKNQIDHGISLQSLGIAHVTKTQASHLTCEDAKSDVTENDPFKFNCLNDNTEVFPRCDNFYGMKYDEFMNELGDYHFKEGVIEPNSTGDNFEYDFDETEISLSIFASPYELNNNVYDSSLSGHAAAWCSINDTYPTHCMDLSGVESALFPPKENEIEHLLEAVAADSCSSSDNNSANQPNIGRASKTSPGIPLASSKIPNKIKRSASWEEHTAPSSFLSPAFIDQGINAVTTFYPSASSIESSITEFLDKQLQQQRKGYYSLNPRKRSRLSSTNKRNVCSVNKQRPRPRDRQLIQDRIKDLRELVPNSDKCSIDGLLDKTIKHMLFLRDVTNQADKLRHQALEEENDQKTTETTEVNCGHQNGTSWAVELGKKHQQCPIVVKDLNHPGQMLIEMLCTDHGRFLEIADVIQRLQLTILKAVMEKCSENSWARFIVEVSGSFQRLDIFWPLMRLLQCQVPMGRKM